MTKTFTFSSVMESLTFPNKTEIALYATFQKRLEKLGKTWENIEKLEKIFLQKAVKNPLLYPRFNKVLKQLYIS